MILPVHLGNFQDESERPGVGAPRIRGSPDLDQLRVALEVCVEEKPAPVLGKLGMKLKAHQTLLVARALHPIRDIEKRLLPNCAALNYENATNFLHHVEKIGIRMRSHICDRAETIDHKRGFEMEVRRCRRDHRRRAAVGNDGWLDDRRSPENNLCCEDDQSTREQPTIHAATIRVFDLYVIFYDVPARQR